MSSDDQAATGGRPPAFAAFAVPNYRRFISGQSLSLVGSWVDTVGQALLVLQLTQSGQTLGAVVAARYLPVLVLTPFAGALVDRADKRKVLLGTATTLAVLAGLLAVLVATHTVALWSVFVIAAGFGCASALDNPARQAFIPELVETRLIRSAVALNSTFANVGRAVGPIIAAWLATTVGIAWCFAVDAISFVAVLVALLALDVRRLHPARRIPRGHHDLRDGLRYARRVPLIVAPIAMMALIGTFTYEFEVSLPLLARGTFGTIDDYPWLIGAFGLGSVVGGIWCAVRQRTGLRPIVLAAGAYAVTMAAVAVAPSLPVAVVLLFAVGVASITFITSGNSTIQVAALPEYRGRVTALWSTAFLGTTPIGSLVIGTIGATHPRGALLVGAAACGLACLLGAVWSRLTGPREPAGPRPGRTRAGSRGSS